MMKCILKPNEENLDHLKLELYDLARLINIDIDHIIPDGLHLLLRVTDKLIENLIHGASTNDHNVAS